MKTAAVKSIANLHARTPLETVIPLSTPFSLMIDVASVCNLKCSFCFHSNPGLIKESNKKFGLLSFDTYKKIIDDTLLFPNQVKRLKLHGFGEPLLNPVLPEMISYAKACNASEDIIVTSNGLLLNEELSGKLIESELDSLYISVSDFFFEECKDGKPSKRIDEYIKNIEFFYKNKKNCFLYVKALDANLSQKQKDFFYASFGSIADQVFIENLLPLWEHEEGKVSALDLYGKPLAPCEVCTHIFVYMMINHEGKAVACCTDWKPEIVLGDVTKESLPEIWNNRAYTEFRLKHLDGKRGDIPFCRHCTSFYASTPDNIDNFREELAEKIRRNL